MPFQLGQQKTGGRQAGTPNKRPMNLQEAIMNSFVLAGAEDYLLKQSEENPVAYLALLGKLLSKNINMHSTGDGSALPIQRIELVAVTQQPAESGPIPPVHEMLN